MHPRRAAGARSEEGKGFRINWRHVNWRNDIRSSAATRHMGNPERGVGSPGWAIKTKITIQPRGGGGCIQFHSGQDEQGWKKITSKEKSMVIQG